MNTKRFGGAFDKQQEQIASQLATLESQRSDLTAERDGLEAQRNALAEERRQWERQRAESPRGETPVAGTDRELPEPPELQFQEPTQQSPVDLNDVFRRIGAKLDLPEAEPTPEPPPTRTVPPARAAGNAPRQTAASAKEESDEESIDDYMSRLMQRVRSTTTEPESPSRATQRPEPIRPSRETSSGAAAVEPSKPVSSTMPQPNANEPEQVQPRKRTPVKPIDLSAFRELANLSARSAIDQHSRRTLIHAMYSKLTVTVVAFVASIGLFWMWKEFALQNDIVVVARGRRGGVLLGPGICVVDRPRDRQEGPRQHRLECFVQPRRECRVACRERRRPSGRAVAGILTAMGQISFPIYVARASCPWPKNTGRMPVPRQMTLPNLNN